MQTSPLDSAQSYALLGADGARGGGDNNLPLGATGVRNSRQDMDTGAGQVVEAPETQEPSKCLDTLDNCVCWFMNCISKKVRVEEAETSVAVVTSQPQAQGATGPDNSQAKAGKAIPKPDARGEKVDLKALESENLDKLSLENATKVASEALENAKKTVCFEYWIYKEQNEPKDKTKVDEAEGILAKVIELVGPFIAPKMTPSTYQLLISLNQLFDECVMLLYTQIPENLPDRYAAKQATNAAEQAIKAEEFALGCADNQAFEIDH